MARSSWSRLLRHGPLIISRKLAGLSSFAVVAASLIITAAIYTVPAMLDLPATVSADTVAPRRDARPPSARWSPSSSSSPDPRGRAGAVYRDHTTSPARRRTARVVLNGQAFTLGIAVGLR